MSISPISSTDPSTNIPAWQALARQRQQNFQSLANSLKSGDLGGAQQAYSDLEAIASSNAPSSPVSSSGGNPIQQDFSTLGQDLSSGNLSQAQKDFTQMSNDLKAVFAQNSGSSPAHHHHGHHAGASTPQTDSSTDPSPNPSLTTPSLSNTIASLLSQYAPATASSNGSMVSSLLNLVA